MSIAAMWTSLCSWLNGTSATLPEESLLNWNSLLISKRRSHLEGSSTPEPADAVEFRTQQERDYDRILFSTPVRRLADKTQVFPLERHDSVRTRLTHSHEVANLARSLGTYLVHAFEPMSTQEFITDRTIPPVLAAIGLAHDLGNPPFGHQGEQAIQRWFADHSDILVDSLTVAMKNDFLKFEGNAQTMRIVTRLQTITNDRGLNLTLGTLAALMKYPTSSDKVDDSSPATKKHGFFQSEADIVGQIWEHTKLKEGVRHPLTWLMEACDDTAYSVLDAEDAIKKGLVSPSDLFSHLCHHGKDDALVQELVKQGEATITEVRKMGLSPSEINDVVMQKFRVNAIGRMIHAARQSFQENYGSIMRGESLEKDLIELSTAATLAGALKNFDKVNAYQHRSVLELELTGFNTLYELMDMLWEGIVNRKEADDLASRRATPFAQYAYGRISENYRRVFVNRWGKGDLPPRYLECQLLTDMVSGMTDSFALSLHSELMAFRNGPSASLQGGSGA